MIILDSNTIIYLSKGLLAIDEVFPDGEGYAVSVVTYMEVMGYPFESAQEAGQSHENYIATRSPIISARKSSKDAARSRLILMLLFLSD